MIWAKKMIRTLPNSNLELREAIFKGDIFLTPANEQSLVFVQELKDLIVKELKIEDIRHVHNILDPVTFFEKIGHLRREIYLSKKYQDLTFQILETWGFNPQEIAFDPFRLRVITPNGNLNPKAAPIYYPHRDTWYSHPQSLIVLWIPLDDLKSEETFIFYPDYFAKPVPNNSEIFNYDNWIKDGPELKIGWQDPNSGITANYPRSQVDFDGGKISGFACKKGEHLFFSGAHYHQTLPQNTEQTRYSIDVRFVHLNDMENNRGAFNVDNRSQGNILKDYITWEKN